MIDNCLYVFPMRNSILTSKHLDQLVIELPEDKM